MFFPPGSILVKIRRSRWQTGEEGVRELLSLKMEGAIVPGRLLQTESVLIKRNLDIW